MLKKFYIFIGLLVGFLPGYAQQISIEFGPRQIPIETYFTISVRLQGAALKQASPFPEIAGFQKSSRSAKKTVLKSGNNLLEEVHTQNYAALNEGIFEIKPFAMTVNGTVVKSPGTTVQVGPVTENEELVTATPPPKVPAEKKNASFLNLETSKSRIYSGEGVHIALYFYLKATENGEWQFYDFLNQLPALIKQVKQPNTWEEVFEQTEIRPDTVQVSQVPYLRYKLYEAVHYPLNNQSLIFPALALKMAKYTPTEASTFAGEQPASELKTFLTEPETITVRALPPHPLRETVPVGRYRLDETIDRTQLRTGRPVNYTYTVIGEGNIGALPAPNQANQTALQIYPPQITQNIERQRERLAGSKQFSYTIIPQAPGRYPLRNLLQLVYFDPVRERYDTLASRLTLQVSGAPDQDAAIQSGVNREFYKLIDTEDNTLTSLHKFEELKLYTNLIVLFLLAISIYIFYRKR